MRISLHRVRLYFPSRRKIFLKKNEKNFFRSLQYEKNFVNNHDIFFEVSIDIHAESFRFYDKKYCENFIKFIHLSRNNFPPLSFLHHTDNIFFVFSFFSFCYIFLGFSLDESSLTKIFWIFTKSPKIAFTDKLHLLFCRSSSRNHSEHLQIYPDFICLFSCVIKFLLFFFSPYCIFHTLFRYFFSRVYFFI